MEHGFHSVDYLDRMQESDTHARSALLTIKEGAYIVAYSIILKGVRMGNLTVFMKILNNNCVKLILGKF